MCHWPKWYHVLNWFFEIYLNFEWYKSFINQYLPHSESKSYHKNSIKLYSSRSFQQHQRHIPILPKISVKIYFLLKKSLNIKKLLHWKSKRHGTKPMYPYSSKAFQRHQEHDLKHPSLVDFILTKQNKTNYLFS